jgi:glycosyltransferase involved in cell wall biosynthesis
MRISLIIPCKNEERYIARCLQSVVDAGVTIPGLSVWVCDGNSTDQTVKLVESFTQKYPFIKLLNNTNETTPHALNLGLKAAAFEVAIILGAHAEIDKHFIEENIATLFSDASIGCAGGIIENVHENHTAKIISMSMSSSFGVGNAHFRTAGKAGFVDTVAFGSYKNEVFEKCGYFDESLTRNQDDEFSHRIIKNGFKIYLNPAIRSKYYVRGSYAKLRKQYFQYGYWKVYVNRKHRTVTTLRQLVPAAMIAGMFLLTVATFFDRTFALLFILCFLLYLFTGFVFARRKTKALTEQLQMIRVFMILHFSYGLGYWKGILDFVISGRQPDRKQTSISR